MSLLRVKAKLKNGSKFAFIAFTVSSFRCRNYCNAKWGILIWGRYDRNNFSNIKRCFCYDKAVLYYNEMAVTSNVNEIR